MSKSTNTPAHDIRYGAIRVAIWENQSESGPFYATTLERFYRDKDGNPQSGHSFTLTDIGLAQLALADAARWITENRHRASDKDAA